MVVTYPMYILSHKFKILKAEIKRWKKEVFCYNNYRVVVGRLNLVFIQIDDIGFFDELCRHDKQTLVLRLLPYNTFSKRTRVQSSGSRIRTRTPIIFIESPKLEM